MNTCGALGPKGVACQEPAEHDGDHVGKETLVNTLRMWSQNWKPNPNRTTWRA